MSDKKKLHAKKSLLERLIKREGRAGRLSNFTDYVGLEGPANKRITGSSDYGTYYDPVGKLTGGIGHLIKDEDEATELLTQTKEQAEDRLLKDTKKAEGYIVPLLKEHDIDPSLIGDTQKEGLLGALFQLGKGNLEKKSGLTGFGEAFKALKEEDYKKMADEAKDSKWYKAQSPNRVEDFIKLMSVGKERDDLREDVKRLGGFIKSQEEGSVEPETDVSEPELQKDPVLGFNEGGIVKKYADGGFELGPDMTEEEIEKLLRREALLPRASDSYKRMFREGADFDGLLEEDKFIGKTRPGDVLKEVDNPFSKQAVRTKELMDKAAKAGADVAENTPPRLPEDIQELLAAAKEKNAPRPDKGRDIITRPKQPGLSDDEFSHRLRAELDKAKRKSKPLYEKAAKAGADVAESDMLDMMPSRKTFPKSVGKLGKTLGKIPGVGAVAGAGIAALMSGDAQAGLGELLGSDTVGDGSDIVREGAFPSSGSFATETPQLTPEEEEAAKQFAPKASLTPEQREMLRSKGYAKGGVVHAEDGYNVPELLQRPDEESFIDKVIKSETEPMMYYQGLSKYQDIPEQPLNQKPEPISDEKPKSAREQALINEIAGLGGEKKVEKTAEGREPTSEPKSEKKPELDVQSKYEQLLAELEKPAKREEYGGPSWGSTLADSLAALSNIYNYAQGDKPMFEPSAMASERARFDKQQATKTASSKDNIKSRADILKQLQDLKKGSKSGFSNDPKSAESLNMADKLKKLYGVDYGGMSEAAMVKAFPGLVSTDRAKFLEKGKESRHKQRFEFKANETEAKRMEKIVSDFNSDPIMRDSKKAIIAADKAETIIKKGGKLAPAVMGRLLARMAGEVGVMTDQDVAAFKGSPQWTDSLQRWFNRGISGKLTKTDKQEMLKMVNNLRTVERSAIAGYADTLAKQYSNASGLSRKRIMSSILPKQSSELFEVSDKVKIQAPNGETRLVDKKSVQKYLDRGGKIIED